VKKRRYGSKKGISTVVFGSFWGVEKIQNGGRCHGNQGAKNVKCSYQVSSISVRRVTCYDHFCVFQFFSILAVSMTTAAILNKIKP
jgi:hypothetical protein